MADRLRVGIIGCGLIAQVQHLPNLRSLPELFEVVAVADRDLRRARSCAERFGVANIHDAAEGLLGEEIDAVVISTSGDHSNLVAVAARSDLAVLVEKPLCLDLSTAVNLMSTLSLGRAKIMLGYMRRYDEAFRGLEAMADAIGPVTLVRTRTAETPASTYLSALAIDEELKADEDPLRVTSDDYSFLEHRISGSALQARLYKNVVLDSLVHELNMVQALAGRARSVAFAELSDGGASVILRCERAMVQLAWLTTPRAARYIQEIQLLGEGGAAAARFDSPYLPVSAGTLTAEGGGPEMAQTWQKTVGPDAVGGFQRELLAFHRMATGDEPARTTLEEAVFDIAAAEAVGRAAVSGEEVAVNNVPVAGELDRPATGDGS